MSYCSNCKVELAPTESLCPLCGTRVKNGSENSCGAYPANFEVVPLSSKHTALIGLITLLFPALCCFTIDVLEDGLMSWSPYIWGAEACLFAFVFLPKLFVKPKAGLCLLVDSAVTAAYLFLIGYLSESVEWVLPLGLPISFLAALIIFSTIKILQMKRHSLLFKAAIIFCSVGIFSVAIEAVIGLFEFGTLVLGWALLVLIPALLIAAAIFYIESDSVLKNRLVRAVFL